jgi:hypothetical protein
LQHLTDSFVIVNEENPGCWHGESLHRVLLSYS